MPDIRLQPIPALTNSRRFSCSLGGVHIRKLGGMLPTPSGLGICVEESLDRSPRMRLGWCRVQTNQLLDLYLRRVAGCALSDHPGKTKTLTLNAPEMAISQCRPAPGPICQTEQGVICRAQRYRQQVDNLGMRRSMSANGSGHGNALAESFFSNLNNERVPHGVFDARETTRAALFTGIEMFYDCIKHSAIKRPWSSSNAV
jgi:transposase InsO family protein